MNTDPAHLLERVTGELHQRFLFDNAEKWHEWATETPWITMPMYDVRTILEWIEYFEPIVEKLVNMIGALTVRRFRDVRGDFIIQFTAEEEMRRREYTAEAAISEMLLVEQQRQDLEDFIQQEIERILIGGLTDMFETYLAEGQGPLVPARQRQL